MKLPSPTRQLPGRPDLDQLRRQAKELLQAYLAGEPEAVAEVNRFYHDANATTFALHHAQLVLARSYGFGSWAKLKAFVDGVTIVRLVDAVKAGDLDQVRGMLEVRPELINLTAPDTYAMPLHYAVLGRMTEMVQLLMRYGADPHAGTAGIYALREAATPLAIAVERGYEEIAAIIRAAVRPVVVDAVAEVRRAFQDGHEDRVIELLQRHPDLLHAQIAPKGRSLLHVAAHMGLARVLVWLLDHGLGVNVQTPDGLTPLDVAANSEIAGLLRARGADATARWAVMSGDTEFLRAKGAELIQPQDERGWLLRAAVDSDRPDILTMLLDMGLDPDARVRVDEYDAVTYTWGMPLYECTRHGKHAMAEILLKRGADANGQVYASGTPLSEAYGQRDEEMIALLERYGGKSNASMAGLYRRPDLARKLLAEYGDAVLPDDGFSGGKVAEQLLHGAARGGDPEILRMALDRVDVPVGHPGWNGLLQGPLGFWNHWIGPWCHLEWDRSTYLTCFRMILEKSGPPNAPLNWGATILHQIVVMGSHVTVEERVAFAEAALDAGARMDLRDDLLKSTPLGWACRWGAEELVRLFLERGADPRELDAEAWATPLAWAEKKGNQRVAEMLREKLAGF